MRRCLLLIAGACVGTVLFLAAYDTARAQPRIGSDEVRFMAAVRGDNHDGTGLKWCVSQSWHESYPGSKDPSNPYPEGPEDALDEVSQTGTSSCASQAGDLVDFAYSGSSNGGAECTSSAPCPSLLVRGKHFIGATSGCNIIEADFYDYDTYDARTNSGDWKGKQRFLHALASPTEWTAIAYVAWQTWYFDFVTVGTIVNESSPCPWTGPHVHQDFMLPRPSQYCQATWNVGTIPAKSRTNRSGFSKDWYRENPNHYVHSLIHPYGVACLVPGPAAADFLLGSSGALDGSGKGTWSLANGNTVASKSTCISGTDWCGTYTITPRLLIAVRSYYLGVSPIDYLRAEQKSLPSSGAPNRRHWYGPDADGWWFAVRWVQTYDGGTYSNDCSPTTPGTQRYFADWKDSGIYTCGVDQALVGQGGEFGPQQGIDYLWGQFRTQPGLNPSAPPTQEAASEWVRNQINSGHWNDGTSGAVKPLLDAVIRAARNKRDMQSLGITEKPTFDAKWF